MALLNTHGLEIVADKPTNSLVYSNPSITSFANSVYRLVHSKASPNKSSTEEMQCPFDECSAMILRTSPQIFQDSSHSSYIIITGSTGSLGSYLLDVLCQSPFVRHIICLNRSSDAAKRQTRIQAERRLVPISPSRVTLLLATLSEPNFGLEQEVYNDLLAKTTHVVHNQWPVNFNRPLSSFHSTLQGVVNLINFASLPSAMRLCC